MPKPKKRAYYQGDLKRALLHTAEDMLQEDPTWQFTLREVARRAGVSHAAPYNHFADKSALLAELAMAGFDRLREELIAPKSRRARSIREQFFDLARAYLHFGETRPALYRLMFSQEVGSNVHLSARALGAFSVLVELLERVRKKACCASDRSVARPLPAGRRFTASRC